MCTQLWTQRVIVFANHTPVYLIFDLHRTVLYCCLKETLESSGWQQKRKLAVLARPETVHGTSAPQKDCYQAKQPSSGLYFHQKHIHGEKYFQTRGYLSTAIPLTSVFRSRTLRCSDWLEVVWLRTNQRRKRIRAHPITARLGFHLAVPEQRR